MFVITPTSGSAIARQLGDLPEPAHPHLQHQHLGARRRGQHLQRQPDLGVEVRRVGGHAPMRGDQRRDQLLRRGLADRAGDRRSRRRRAPAARRVASALQRRERVVGGEHHAPAERRPRARRRDEHAPRAGAPARPRRTAAVDPLPAQADEQVAGLDRARVDRRARARARRRAVARRAGHELRRAGEPPVGRPRRGSRSSSRSWRPSTMPRFASRATCESSNGSLRPFSNSWPCSWPLPAITTTSPGSASEIARKIAARRSTSRSTAACGDAGMPADDLVDDRLRLLGARVVGGDDREVRQPRRDLAHHRPLAAVAVAARAEHDDQPPGRQLARRQQHLLQRVRLVRVVDEHARTAAPRRPAGSAPAAVTASASDAASAVRPGAERPRRGPARRARSATLNRPRQRQRAAKRPSGVTTTKSQPVASVRTSTRAVVRLALDRERDARRTPRSAAARSRRRR